MENWEKQQQIKKKKLQRNHSIDSWSYQAEQNSIVQKSSQMMLRPNLQIDLEAVEALNYKKIDPAGQSSR